MGISGRRAARLITALGLIGPLLGLGVYWIAWNFENQRALRRFDGEMAKTASAIERCMAGSLESLRAVGDLIDSREAITGEEFSAFTAGLLRRHQEIQALEWAPRVAAAERETHEARARAEGFAGYRITVRDGQGNLTPSPPRDVYYPVSFVEPHAGNESALGFDLGSDDTRRAALLRAMQSAELTLTDPLILVQEPRRSRGLLAVLPLYRGIPSTSADRQDRLRGFALGVFRVEEILGEAFRDAVVDAALREQLTLVDEGASGARDILYSGPRTGADIPAATKPVEKSITVGARQWRLIGRPSAAYLAQHRTYQALALGFGAFLGWELLMLLALVIQRRSVAAAERGRFRFLDSVLRSLPDGVVVADRSGKVVLANEVAKRMGGPGARDVPPPRWPEAFGMYRPDGETPFPAEQLPLLRAIRGEEVFGEEIFVRNPQLPSGAWFSVNGTPLRGESGELIGGIVVFRDITSRKRSEEDLERLSNAVEQTGDTVIITDREGRIEYVNPAFEKTTGYARDEALGQTPGILKSGRHDSAFYEGLWKTILGGKIFRGSIVNRKKSGEVYHAEQTITPILNGTGRVTHFVSVVKDMTERLRRQEREMEAQLASIVQQRLYPQKAPELPRFDIAGATFPAEDTCGDYFDYVEGPDGSLVIAIGDVSGHGFPSALLMVETRSYVRSLLRSGVELGEVLNRVSADLGMVLEDSKFVTLLLARLDPRRRRLAFANAGHTPGIILDRSGVVKAELKSNGLPLGIFPDRKYNGSEECQLDAGDLAVFLTDGVTETRAANGSFFESSGVLTAIRSHLEKPAAEILQHVHRASREFSGDRPQVDDATLVICKVDPDAR